MPWAFSTGYAIMFFQSSGTVMLVPCTVALLPATTGRLACFKGLPVGVADIVYGLVWLG